MATLHLANALTFKPVVATISPDAADVNGLVQRTIAGTGFTGATAVFLGGVAATSVVVVNDTTITCIVPAHAAGPVDVVVTVNGIDGVLAAGFAYLAPGRIPLLMTALPGATVEVEWDGRLAATVIANESGIASAEIEAGLGAHSISARQKVKGIASPLSVTVHVTGVRIPPPSLLSLSPSTGSTAGGAQVALTGADFQAGATVTFGGVAATVSSVSPTSISVTTPACPAGVVDVVVANPDGQSATLTAAFTFMVLLWIGGNRMVSWSPGIGNFGGGFAAPYRSFELTGGDLSATGLFTSTAKVLIDGVELPRHTSLEMSGTYGGVISMAAVVSDWSTLYKIFAALPWSQAFPEEIRIVSDVGTILMVNIPTIDSCYYSSGDGKIHLVGRHLLAGGGDVKQIMMGVYGGSSHVMSLGNIVSRSDTELVITPDTSINSGVHYVPLVSFDSTYLPFMNGVYWKAEGHFLGP